MAHALLAYDGVCSNIHGHSYNLEITLSGKVHNSPGHPKDGMVMDFHDLKLLVKKHVVDEFDHSLMVNSRIPEESAEALMKTTDRIRIVNFQPTTENIITHIAEILMPLLPEGVKLFSIRLYETVTSFAEWYASDNP